MTSTAECCFIKTVERLMHTAMMPNTIFHCWDRQDWKLYGFTFSVSGDAVEIDFACKKRKKFSIVDFIDDTDSELTFESAIKDVFDAVINTKNTEVSNLKLYMMN